MLPAARFAGLGVLLAATLAAGCSRDPDPPAADPPAPAPAPAEKQADDLPDPTGGRVRGGKDDAPPRQPRPGEISLPPDGGAWPWAVAPSPAAVITAPVDLSKRVPKNAHVSGATLSLAARRAVVLVPDSVGVKNPVTRVYLCNLATGTIPLEWEVKGRFAPLDLRADGAQFLTTRDNHGAHTQLDVWTITPDDELKRRTWQPHKPDPIGGDVIVAGGGRDLNEDVKWAAFAGPDRIVTASAGGQVRVWDAATLTRVGSVDGVPGVPALTPDGKYVTFLVRGAVALLDPATAKVVGVRKIGHPPDGPVLAFSPDGKTLAVGGTGRTVLLDLDSGQVWDAIVAEMRTTYLGALPDFGWAGDRHFYSDGHLYDPDTPIPLWSYHGAVWAQPRGREVWAVTAPLVTPGKEKVITLRAYTLPHPGVQAKIDAKLARPGVFALRPGDAVTIDVSALPADHRAEARAALDRQAKAVGYRPAPAAAIAIVATADGTGPKRSATYNNWLTGGSERIEYVERHARLKVVRVGDGRVLHQAEASHPAPFSIHLKPGEKVVDHTGHAGEPDYRLYDRKLPAVVRGPAAIAGALGWGTFTASGVEDRKTRLDDLQ